MNPYGSDRVRPGRAGQWMITSRRPKGWTARVPKTLTTAPHPGTAVLWDEQYFEVISAEPGPAGTVRYVLEPWAEEHAMRLTDAYDAASEARREEEHRKAAVREKGRVAANLFGVLTGNLPAIVQEQLSSEIGISPTRLTVVSFVLPILIEAYVAMRMVGHILDPTRRSIPLVLALLAVYLMFETFIRIHLVWSLNRPVGSAFGFAGYAVWWLIRGRSRGALSPFAQPKGSGVVMSEAPVDVELQDFYTLREPLLSLLTPAEQQALAARFGFNYRKQSLSVIAVLLFLSSAGIVTSILSLNARGASLSALSSLILAAAILGEQIYRLYMLQRTGGPMGSFLGVLVRPFVRKLFAAPTAQGSS